MKYAILIYAELDGWVDPAFFLPSQARKLTRPELDQLRDRSRELINEITESGELLDSAMLGDPLNTVTTQVRDDVLTIAHGPYLQVEEQLAGYYVVDCDTLDRATEIAGRFIDARFAAVEVRPIMSTSGLEM